AFGDRGGNLGTHRIVEAEQSVEDQSFFVLVPDAGERRGIGGRFAPGDCKHADSARSEVRIGGLDARAQGGRNVAMLEDAFEGAFGGDSEARAVTHAALTPYVGHVLSDQIERIVVNEVPP